MKNPKKNKKIESQTAEIPELIPRGLDFDPPDFVLDENAPIYEETGQLFCKLKNKSFSITEQWKLGKVVIPCIIPGFIIPCNGMIYGEPGVGKSMFALEMSFGVAGGFDVDKLLLNILEPGAKPAKVLYLSAEDDERVVKNRTVDMCNILEKEELVKLIDHNLNIITIASGNIPFGLRNPKGYISLSNNVPLLANYVRDNKIKLIVMDTFSKFNTLEENSTSDMTGLMGVFRNICDYSGASILFIHHTNKESLKDKEEKTQVGIRGSSAITGECRYIAGIYPMTNTVFSKTFAETKNLSESEQEDYICVKPVKVNSFKKNTGLKWYKRDENGILLPVKLTQANFKKEMKKKEKKSIIEKSIFTLVEKDSEDLF